MISSSTILLDIIGPEKMEAVCEELGNQEIYIPAKFTHKARDKKIKFEFTDKLQNGSTCMGAYEQLSKEFEISPRQVRRILAKR